MKNRLQKFLHDAKPGVPRRTHLFLAAMLWTVVGFVLMLRGSLWLIEINRGLLLVPALLVGSLKSFFILDKSAKKSIDRIRHMADGSCLGAVYSVKTWLLVLLMMSTGYVLRNSSVPLVFIGLLYAAIGWALFFSSRLGWYAWRNMR